MEYCSTAISLEVFFPKMLHKTPDVQVASLRLWNEAIHRGMTQSELSLKHSIQH